MSDSDPNTSALVAAKNRIKTLLDTVKRLEEERGLALRRVAEAVSTPHVVDDLELARLLVGVLPRVANRELPSHVLAVALALRPRPLVVKELRDVLCVPQATTSVWLKDAVEAGVVEVSSDEKDKRVTRASLSPKGLRYFRDARRSEGP